VHGSVLLSDGRFSVSFGDRSRLSIILLGVLVPSFDFSNPLDRKEKAIRIFLDKPF